MSEQIVDMLEAVQRPQVARLQAEVQQLRAELGRAAAAGDVMMEAIDECHLSVPYKDVERILRARDRWRALRAAGGEVKADVRELGRYERLVAEQDEQITALTAEVAALRAACAERGSLLMQLTDWDGPGSGTGERTCLSCQAKWYGGLDDEPQMEHASDCILATDPAVHGQEILAAAREVVSCRVVQEGKLDRIDMIRIHDAVLALDRALAGQGEREG